MELMLNTVTKNYRSNTAVDKISVTLHNGVYGLVGPNGAGKSTLMRLICGILKPTSGEIAYNATPIQQNAEYYRSLLGYLPQDFGYYPEFTALRFLLYISALKGLNKKESQEKSLELLEMVGLTDVQHKKIKTFSGGMKRRLGIAQALLNDPQILILDEPTAGLDPKERVRFRNLLSSLGNRKIILLSTHIISDVEYIAEQILLMNHGKLIEENTPEKLLEPMKNLVWECESNDKKLIDTLSNNYNVCNIRNSAQGTTLRILSSSRPDPTAVLVTPTLEDYYLYSYREEGTSSCGN